MKFNTHKMLITLCASLNPVTFRLKRKKETCEVKRRNEMSWKDLPFDEEILYHHLQHLHVILLVDGMW